MANTYIPIASVTVGAGGAASIDFTSIPQTYTDLLLKVSIRSSYGANEDDLLITLNGSSSGYSHRVLQGNGSTAISVTLSSITNKFWPAYQPGSTGTSNSFSNMEMYIPNYTSSNYKSVSFDGVEEQNATTAYMRLTAGLLSNTAAVSSISIFGNANLVQYSTAYLYGIKNS